jgi:hypothetical protein
VLEYPQSGERIRGRRNTQITRAKQPSKKRFAVRRVSGSGDLWVTEYILTYDGKPILHREHYGVQRRQGCTGNAVLCGSFRGERLARSMGRTDGCVTTKRDSEFLRNRQLDFFTGRVEVAVICPRARSIEWIHCGYYIEAVRRLCDGWMNRIYEYAPQHIAVRPAHRFGISHDEGLNGATALSERRPAAGSTSVCTPRTPLLILFTDSLGVSFAVRIKEVLAALLPRRLQFGRCDVPVWPAFLGNST